jgi:hypothetical protein
VQHERDADGPAEPGDQGEVEDRVLGQHGVRAAHRDGQRVHLGGRDEAGRLVRIGAGPRGVHAVLAADLAQLRLDPDAPVVTPRGDFGGGPDVVREREPGRVVHHRPEAERRRRPHQLRARRVVQVYRDRHRGRPRDGQAGPGDGLKGAVPGGAVLADLQHHRGPGRLGAGDDRLGVLDTDDVERAHAAARGPGRTDDLAHDGQRHQRTSSTATALSAPR